MFGGFSNDAQSHDTALREVSASHSMITSYGAPVAIPVGQKSRLGIYFHVPFCPHICPYCDFVKTSRFTRGDVKAFFQAAQGQLRHMLALWAPPGTENAGEMCTVYFGGGTPGLFGGRDFQGLVDLIREKFSIEELTIETNPLTNGRKRLESLRLLGVNRITLGAQSLCPQALKALGRQHSPEDVLRNITWARELGFEQVQVDLIYGLTPGVRTFPLSGEVDALVAAGATGISGYALTIEERTQFRHSQMTNEEEAVRDFEALYFSCTQHGMRHLETSNFSFYEAKHNNIYWHGLPYLGVGTGAHGLIPASPDNPYGRRYRVGDVLGTHAPGDDALPFAGQCDQLFALQWDAPRTRAHLVDELLFTLLRTTFGVPWEFVDWAVGSGGRERVESHPSVAQARDEGRLILNDRGIHLSWREKLFGDHWALQLARLLVSP